MFQKAPDFKIKLQHFFLLRNPVKIISQKADIVFSYGGKITDIIRSLDVTPEKIIELPSGVESNSLSNEIKPVGQILRFLFLGRYERRKGIEELNDAISTIVSKEQKQKTEFHFIGPIPQEKHLQNKAVIYHGEIRDKVKLTAAIKNCDVLICPSWSEGMPNVILEAMANGLTVIATDVGAVNVLVNDKTGYLITNSHSVEILHAIETVCNSTNTDVNEKKQNALNYIKESFVWEKLINKFLNLIK
jgi:glycosyltransferase involved in cell wall biosynthesis